LRRWRPRLLPGSSGGSSHPPQHVEGQGSLRPEGTTPRAPLQRELQKICRRSFGAGASGRARRGLKTSQPENQKGAMPVAASPFYLLARSFVQEKFLNDSIKKIQRFS